MSGIEQRVEGIFDQEATDRPLVGYVATDENTDALMRSILRARRNGYESLVTYSTNHPPEGISLAEELGATILSPESADVERETLRLMLVTAAKVHGSRGLILAPVDCQVIDFDRSIETLESSESFSVDAITRSNTDSASSPTIVAGIPAYNEERTIGAVVSEVRNYVDTVIVVDDGSDDDTSSVARDAGATVVAHDTNRGYGRALKTAFERADEYGAETLITLDGDGQHEPSDIPALADKLNETDAEVVIGSRFVGDGEVQLPVYRLFGIKVINVLTNISMGMFRPRSWVSDTQCGFRAYNRTAIESIAIDRGITQNMGASTDILHHAHQHNYSIDEVGTTVSYDVENASSQNPVSHGLTLVTNLITTVERQRPLTFIGIPGFVLALFGFGLAVWSASNITTADPLVLGTVIASMFIVLTGLLMCITGLILHSLTVHFDTEVDST